MSLANLFSQSQVIPKTIFTFWEPSPPPSLVDKCIATWRQHSPDYSIVVLNLANYRKWCSIDVTTLRHYDPKLLQRTSDFIRAVVLRENGGVWLDATSIMTANLGLIIDARDTFVIYSKTPKNFHSHPENWFFACAKEHPFMQMWCDEFLRSNQFETMKAYLDDAKTKITDPYFAMYAASIVAMRKYPARTTLKILNATGPINGPFYLWQKNKWSGDALVEELCQTPRSQWTKPLIKLTQRARAQMIENPHTERCLFGTTTAAEHEIAYGFFSSQFAAIFVVVLVVILLLVIFCAKR